MMEPKWKTVRVTLHRDGHRGRLVLLDRKTDERLQKHLDLGQMKKLARGLRLRLAAGRESVPLELPNVGRGRGPSMDRGPALGLAEALDDLVREIRDGVN